MRPPDPLGVALPALILEAAKLAKDRAEGFDTDASFVFQAFWHFYRAYHQAVAAIPAEADLDPPRFRAAIQAVEPGVYDLATLASTLTTACSEVTQEGGFPPADPAIRLLAYQTATVCVLAPDRGEGAELIFDCTRRVIGR